MEQPGPRAVHSPRSHFSDGRTQSEPGSERERESEGRAGRKGRRVPGAGGTFKPQPGRAPARLRRGANKAGSVRGRHASAGTGGTAAAPARHRPALVPPDKGDGGPRRVEDAGARGTAPATAARAFHGAAFPRGAGMREVPPGMRGWSAARRGSGAREAEEKLRGEQAGGENQAGLGAGGFCCLNARWDQRR